MRQRKRGAHWLAHNPHGGLSEKQDCSLRIQQENNNAVADLCNWYLKDPDSGMPYRKHTRSNTDSLYVFDAMNKLCPGKHEH